MRTYKTKEILLDTTKRLLRTSEDIRTITARKIAIEANVNLAMINYCFQSKDNLLYLAVEEIISADFDALDTHKNEDLDAKEQLFVLLVSVSEVMIKYKEIVKMTIPHILLHAPITLPNRILPYIIRYTTLDTQTCRRIAFQMVTYLQILFYRFDEYCEYLGVSIHTSIDMMEEIKIDIRRNLDAFLKVEL